MLLVLRSIIIVFFCVVVSALLSLSTFVFPLCTLLLWVVSMVCFLVVVCGVVLVVCVVGVGGVAH